MTLTELSLVAISTHKLSFKNCLASILTNTLSSHGSTEMKNALWATLGPIAMNMKPIRNSTLVQCMCTLPSIEIRKFTSFWRNMNDFEMVSTSYIERNLIYLEGNLSTRYPVSEYAIQLDLGLSITIVTSKD